MTKITTAVDPIVEGDAIQYVVTVTNNGPDDATGVEITDQLPSNLDFDIYTADQGTYDDTTGLWSGISLTSGQSATLTINTTLADGGGFTNTATITASSEADSFTDNNSDSVFISGLKSFDADACIISMNGFNNDPNDAIPDDQIDPTADNTLTVYGLLYDLVKENQIPVYWSIRPDKSFDDPATPYDPACDTYDTELDPGDDGYNANCDPDDGVVDQYEKVDEVDLTVNGVDYSSGAFIIDPLFVDAAMPIINEWKALYPTLYVECNQPIFNAPIHEVLTSFPRAVLDSANGGIIESIFYDHTNLTNEIIGYNDPPDNDDPIYSLYRPDGAPSNLGVCDDIYAMPHADPHAWDQAEKDTFDAFIKRGGWVHLGCHAVSSLESVMPYLSEEGLVLWGDHGDGTLPYAYSTEVGAGQYNDQVASDPIMQFLGTIDESLLIRVGIDLYSLGSRLAGHHHHRHVGSGQSGSHRRRGVSEKRGGPGGLRPRLRQPRLRDGGL